MAPARAAACDAISSSPRVVDPGSPLGVGHLRPQLESELEVAL